MRSVNAGTEWRYGSCVNAGTERRDGSCVNAGTEHRDGSCVNAGTERRGHNLSLDILLPVATVLNLELSLMPYRKEDLSIWKTHTNYGCMTHR